MKLTHKLAVVASACLMSLSLVGCGSQNNANAKNSSTKSLATQNYRPGTKAYENVNHNKSTLNPKSWKYDHVIYSKLDRELRTSRGNTGYLDKQNIANDSLRVRQVVKPTGYHQKFVNGQPIINRGHEIAYSLSRGIDQNGKYNPKHQSGDQNNPKNLFTQSAFSNQEIQTLFESKVRNALKHNEKVIYQVKPIFHGSDQMAKGVQMQAISTNRKLNFNVYLFNVQPGIRFNYATGRSVIDKQMKVPTPKNAPHFNDNRRGNYHNMHRRGYRGYGRRYYPRRHHFVRHYAEYRLARHMMHRHYYHHYAHRPYRHFGRREFHHYRHY